MAVSLLVPLIAADLRLAPAGWTTGAVRKVDGVAWPQQCSVVTVQWADDNGKVVLDDRKLVERYLTSYTPWAPIEYAIEGNSDANGWTELSGDWQAPGNAKFAFVELHGRWAPRGRMLWSDISLRESGGPTPRIVRLAAVHLQPRAGKTPEEKRVQLASLIAEAGRRKANLIVAPGNLDLLRNRAYARRGRGANSRSFDTLFWRAGQTEWPVYRAVENHVYLVSSTYEPVSSNWMLSAIWDHAGGTLSRAEDWGTLAFAEVDLNETTRWRSLGDFRSKLYHHLPMTKAGTIWKSPSSVQ